MHKSLALAVLSAASAAATTYNILETYSGSNFFDGFEFFNESDPSNGFVDYLDKQAAHTAHIVKTVGSQAYMGVDYHNSYSTSSSGRPSVRITTKDEYTHGLFIVDIAHMPGSVCGSWPAFWSFGSNWPYDGEIDIIEGANTDESNTMTLHTSDSCSITAGTQSGKLVGSNCAESFSSTGCSVDSTVANSYGTNFNKNGGGVYAMEWTSEAISMWFFPRDKVPASISWDIQDTSTFGKPAAMFQGGSGCDIDARFQNHNFVFDTTFCGDLAGNAYETSGCPMYPDLSTIESCVQYVATTPSAFDQTYWLINSFKVYSATGSSSSLPSGSYSPTTTPTPYPTTIYSTVGYPSSVPSAGSSYPYQSSPASGYNSSKPHYNGKPPGYGGYNASASHAYAASTPCTSEAVYEPTSYASNTPTYGDFYSTEGSYATPCATLSTLAYSAQGYSESPIAAYEASTVAAEAYAASSATSASPYYPTSSVAAYSYASSSAAQQYPTGVATYGVTGSGSATYTASPAEYTGAAVGRVAAGWLAGVGMLLAFAV